MRDLIFLNVKKKGEGHSNLSKLRWVTSEKDTCHCNIFDHDKRQLPHPVHLNWTNSLERVLEEYWLRPCKARHAQFLRMGPETFPRGTPSKK